MVLRQGRQIAHTVLGYRQAVYEERRQPRGGIVHARKELDDGRLPAAVGAYDDHKLARLDLEVDVLETGLGRLGARIVEGEIPGVSQELIPVREQGGYLSSKDMPLYFSAVA